ncbi:V-snare-domain-containing protein [Saitoella complicata NRRL Y-17804]|uniref:V-snare-domain-containing protein n=1 Tax=Saitoella complicata (strain BCRC 22490 / CBS 7301 / JCM 7358 / NBRC 10748 / NRRL Y-17804) TaxID=698492 RepID=UPI000867777C|nr:V-snare-domain-containing protein [Saitoella complicata NRRL Y-17804]ODQ53716.1 V-snare-domain-containing protein [Saitoella complicata NRRL Y-17804]
MNVVYNQALRQLTSLRTDLDNLQNAYHDSTQQQPNITALQGQMSASFSSLSRTIDDYDNMSKREADGSAKKEKARMRVGELRRDVGELRKKFGDVAREGGAAHTNRGRGELLRRGPGRGDGLREETSTPENPYATQVAQNREDAVFRDQDFLGRTDVALDEFLERGRAVLGDLKDQKSMLKGTKTKILDAAHTLGISRETISKVERRARQDKWIFWGGVVFTLTCFWLIFKWLR